MYKKRRSDRIIEFRVIQELLIQLCLDYLGLEKWENVYTYLYIYTYIYICMQIDVYTYIDVCI